jgi:hypothetical protein
MSEEQLTAKELNKVSQIHSFKTVSKVNINDLLSKVREEKTKERAENYIFLGLVVGALAITGIIASL